MTVTSEPKNFCSVCKRHVVILDSVSRNDKLYCPSCENSELMFESVHKQRELKAMKKEQKIEKVVKTSKTSDKSVRDEITQKVIAYAKSLNENLDLVTRAVGRAYFVLHQERKSLAAKTSS